MYINLKYIYNTIILKFIINLIQCQNREQPGHCFESCKVNHNHLHHHLGLNCTNINIKFCDLQRDEAIVIPLKSRITLTKKDETGAKALNDSLMSRLRPMYRGSASALAALAGAENGVIKKEDCKIYHNYSLLLFLRSKSLRFLSNFHHITQNALI